MKIIITILAAMAVIDAVIAYACCAVAGRADDAAEEYFVDLLVYYRNVANDIFKRDNEGRHASEQTYSAEYQKFVGMQSAMKEVLDYFSKFELKGGDGK